MGLDTFGFSKKAKKSEKKPDGNGNGMSTVTAALVAGVAGMSDGANAKIPPMDKEQGLTQQNEEEFDLIKDITDNIDASVNKLNGEMQEINSRREVFKSTLERLLSSTGSSDLYMAKKTKMYIKNLDDSKIVEYIKSTIKKLENIKIYVLKHPKDDGIDFMNFEVSTQMSNAQKRIDDVRARILPPQDIMCDWFGVCNIN